MDECLIMTWTKGKSCFSLHFTLHIAAQAETKTCNFLMRQMVGVALENANVSIWAGYMQSLSCIGKYSIFGDIHISYGFIETKQDNYGKSYNACMIKSSSGAAREHWLENTQTASLMVYLYCRRMTVYLCGLINDHHELEGHLSPFLNSLNNPNPCLQLAIIEHLDWFSERLVPFFA